MSSYSDGQPAVSSTREPNNNSECQSSLSEKCASLHSGQSSLSSSGQANDEAKLLSSNADYDRIRNKTLLFFLDRLYIASQDGKEARTLHDLSCLFGTKEFTKEMRQVVGASRNGLSKFLQSYPSLFTIEGDKVYLTQLKQDLATPIRDYNKEAVEYFKQKLLQFGTSLVPIKNLFGYRSQASQEVRHVSGKSTRDFKQFLRAHDDVFEIMAGEHVVLKSALRELESRGQTQPELQLGLLPTDETVMDPYLNKQFAHFVEDCMKRMMLSDQPDGQQDVSRVTLEYLHEKINQDCSNQLFLKMVKTIEDLRVFLRMHPKLFKRFKCDQDGKDYVSLLSDEERKELETQTYASMSSSQQHSTLERSNTIESLTSNGSSVNLHQQPLSLPPLSNISSSPSQQKKSSDSPCKNAQLSSMQTDHHQPPVIKSVKRTDEQRKTRISATVSTSHQCQNQPSPLRATAPPFVPLKATGLARKQVAPVQTGSSSTIPTIQRSLSNLMPSLRQDSKSRGWANSMVMTDQRNGNKNYLMRSQSSNTSCTNNNLYWSSNRQTNSIPDPSSNVDHQINGNQVNGDYLRARTVDIVREVSNIVTRIMNTTDAVAFDCKGYNLGFEGQITLIQFGFLPKESSSATATSVETRGLEANNENSQLDKRLKPEVCVFDLITNPELAYCLKPLLESDKVIKIVHDVRNKSNALYVQFKIILNNVFDTQVANLVIQQQDTGKPAYKSRYISMSKLCEVYGDEELMKYRNIIKSKTRSNQTSSQTASSSSSNSRIKDVNYWRTRPLTKSMIFESTMDVYCLVGGIYQNLKAKIKPEYKPLFDQLNLEGVLARIKPDEIRSAKKERKIDLEVIDLKRKLYTDTKSSIVLSNREIRLLRHIDLTEEVRKKIQQCKKVSKKLERLDMKASQNAQMLQSMNSQLSSGEQQEQQSLDKNADRSSSTSSIKSSNNSQDNNTETNELNNYANVNDNDDDTTDMMTNFMDSSMFDELKDKMIESSSLLESLEEDDDDIGEHGQLSSVHSHHGSNHECCKCLCHRSSTDTGGGPSDDKTNLSLKSNSSSSTTNSTSNLQDDPAMMTQSSSGTAEQQDANSDTKSAVDMAVQCDLLS